jgi:hypothetical protein
LTPITICDKMGLCCKLQHTPNSLLKECELGHTKSQPTTLYLSPLLAVTKEY